MISENVVTFALVITSTFPMVAGSSVNADENDSNKFEGDLDIDQRHIHGIKNGILTDETRIWPRRTIPFQISEKFDDSMKNIILGAMMEIEMDTCIVFRPFRGSNIDYDYAFIQRGSRGCSSKVGRAGGKQNLTLTFAKSPRGNCLTHGEVLHELLHLIGFWHEHSRPDRDKYITVRSDLAKKANRDNFKKHYEVQDFQLPYDFSSILHYSKDAFQRFPSYITIIPKINQAPIGIRNHLSHFDKIKVNRLYRCHPYH